MRNSSNNIDINKPAHKGRKYFSVSSPQLPVWQLCLIDFLVIVALVILHELLLHFFFIGLVPSSDWWLRLRPVVEICAIPIAMVFCISVRIYKSVGWYCAISTLFKILQLVMLFLNLQMGTMYSRDIYGERIVDSSLTTWGWISYFTSLSTINAAFSIHLWFKTRNTQK